MQGKPGNYREAREAREAWGLSEGQELWGAPGRAKTLGTVGSASEARHQAKPSLSDILWHSDTSHSYHTRLLRFIMSLIKAGVCNCCVVSQRHKLTTRKAHS